MDLLIAGLLLAALIVLANYLELRNRPNELTLFNVLLFLTNVPVVLIGLLLIVAPAALLEEAISQTGISLGNFQSVGIIFVLMGLWGMAVCWRPVRQALARLLPLDPRSPVHTLALMLTAYLIGQGALTLSQGGLSGLVNTVQPASLGLFVVSEAVYAATAFAGVGIVVRRDVRQTFERLGLKRPQPVQLAVAAGWIIVLVILQAIAGALWSLLSPQEAEVLDNVNTILMQNINSVWAWLILAVAAGIGEELLFRGALQPVLGLGFTAVIFAFVHVQYGFTPINLFIVFLALILGYVRRRYSTTVAILVHAGYNFTLGLLALLASYLQQFVT